MEVGDVCKAPPSSPLGNDSSYIIDTPKPCSLSVRTSGEGGSHWNASHHEIWASWSWTEEFRSPDMFIITSCLSNAAVRVCLFLKEAWPKWHLHIVQSSIKHTYNQQCVKSLIKLRVTAVNWSYVPMLYDSVLSVLQWSEQLMNTFVNLL